jgi:hypothetical protein
VLQVARFGLGLGLGSASGAVPELSWFNQLLEKLAASLEAGTAEVLPLIKLIELNKLPEVGSASAPVPGSYRLGSAYEGISSA